MALYHSEKIGGGIPKEYLDRLILPVEIKTIDLKESETESTTESFTVIKPGCLVVIHQFIRGMQDSKNYLRVDCSGRNPASLVYDSEERKKLYYRDTFSSYNIYDRIRTLIYETPSPALPLNQNIQASFTLTAQCYYYGTGRIQIFSEY